MTKNPLLGALDPNEFDNNIRPQDDLYRFVNGKWIEACQIPADKSADGSFYVLTENSEKQVRAIIEDCVEGKIAGELAGKVAALYGSFMDEAQVEADSAPSLERLFAPLRTAKTKGDLRDLWAKTWKMGTYDGFFSMGIDIDLNNPDCYINYFSQDGIGLPERAYFLEEKHREVLQAYREHVGRMFSLSGFMSSESQSQAAGNTVVDFETEIARLHWDNVKTRDTDATNNPMTWAELAANLPVFDLDAWRAASRLPEKMFTQVNVGMPDFFAGMDQLWAETDFETLRLWMTWQALNGQVSLLSNALVQANFEFYGKRLAGREVIRDRWKRGVSLASSVMGEALGQLYVARHFPPDSKEKMSRLVDNLIAAYRESISSLEWMGSETRAKALEKLSLFTPKIGYPDKWRNYEKLDVSAPTLVEKVASASQFGTDFWIDKLGGPVDHTIWHMTPQTVNAYYNPTDNEIVFPAGILQPPFFDPQADDAVNYGSIGAVIGHEIGHGFDDQGAKFDGHGKVENWWTETDLKEFEKRTRALIAQYDQYVPRGLPEEFHVNGALTIGENIGDLGGLDIAWKAYLLALKDQGINDPADAPVIEGYTGAQRFFYSWALSWQNKTRVEAAKQLIAIDPHSPAEFRCNGVVANLDLFAKTFGLKPGDDLWIEPESRVRIW
ncbi:peptidase M13 [Mobiluncus mulieris]|uniref:Peptidase M13 n=1 Tax=Mobiluncus mulieris TaxID=2052 RepID=A0A7Y0U436_9ACTO|nr:M13-type metalloendopeptidase [Mobiluncus mulieris]NMW66073.1 peptidase M13 [Mobiluncus mulieris]